MDIRFYLQLFIRRLPYFLVFAAAGTAAGIAFAIILPASYSAAARLVVESEQIPDELAASTVRTAASETLQIIEQRILTRETLLDMSNRLGIFSGPAAPDEPMTPDAIVKSLSERIRIVTQGGAMVRGQVQATIVTVSFSAPTARLAADVTNEVVTLILQENVEMRTTVAGQTLDFFTQQVDTLEQELTQISAQILQFQEANQDALPDSLNFRRQQQAAAQERLVEQERIETVLRDRRERLIQLYEQTGSIDALIPEQQMSAEELRLRQLRDQYATSVAVLSLDNPRVAVLRSQIEALENVVEEQKAAQSGAGLNGSGGPLDPLQIQLADIDGQLEFVAAQKDQIQANLDDLAETIAATPANAVTLERLERNYDNLRSQYDRAVANKAQAETGEVIESLSRGQRISVIEPAIPPSQPTSPDRRRIAMAGMVGGIGLGFGFIALLELLNRAIRRPADLTKALEITPLVTLPYLRTEGQIWRRRMIVATVLVLVLVGLPAGLWYVDQNIRPLQPVFQAILERVGLSNLI